MNVMLDDGGDPDGGRARARTSARPCGGASGWPRSVSRLRRSKPEMLRELLEDAWEGKAPRRLRPR